MKSKKDTSLHAQITRLEKAQAKHGYDKERQMKIDSMRDRLLESGR